MAAQVLSLIYHDFRTVHSANKFFKFSDSLFGWNGCLAEIDKRTFQQDNFPFSRKSREPQVMQQLIHDQEHCRPVGDEQCACFAQRLWWYNYLGLIQERVLMPDQKHLSGDMMCSVAPDPGGNFEIMQEDYSICFVLICEAMIQVPVIRWSSLLSWHNHVSYVVAEMFHTLTGQI